MKKYLTHLEWHNPRQQLNFDKGVEMGRQWRFCIFFIMSAFGLSCHHFNGLELQPCREISSSQSWVPCWSSELKFNVFLPTPHVSLKLPKVPQNCDVLSRSRFLAQPNKPSIFLSLCRTLTSTQPLEYHLSHCSLWAPESKILTNISQIIYQYSCWVSPSRSFWPSTYNLYCYKLSYLNPIFVHSTLLILNLLTGSLYVIHTFSILWRSLHEFVMSAFAFLLLLLVYADWIKIFLSFVSLSHFSFLFCLLNFR